MFESLVARSAILRPCRTSPESRTHCCMIFTAVEVLPVPGGPCTKVTEEQEASSSARTWLLFRLPPDTLARLYIARRSPPIGGERASSATRRVPTMQRSTGGDGRCFWPSRRPLRSLCSCRRFSGSARRCTAAAMRPKLMRFASLSTRNCPLQRGSPLSGLITNGRATSTSHSQTWTCPRSPRSWSNEVKATASPVCMPRRSSSVVDWPPTH
mmetsp:Transcript_65687/g.143178  ORF Transcript_65687/g.143178 Transcript_65687/m.143178 type:complete len:212 (+) Transcript_65687:315-950(+)